MIWVEKLALKSFGIFTWTEDMQLSRIPLHCVVKGTSCTFQHAHTLASLSSANLPACFKTFQAGVLLSLKMQIYGNKVKIRILCIECVEILS